MFRSVLSFVGVLSVFFLVGERGAAHAAAAGGSVQLSASSFTVAQNAGTLKITITRTGGSAGAVHAYYGTHWGTALDDIDYTNTYGSVTWAAGDAAAKTISIPISNAKPFTGTKQLSFTVSQPTGAQLGSPSAASITIKGAAGASTLAMPSSYSVPQTANVLTVTVNRLGSTTGAVKVTHTTSNGTAVAGQNYTSVQGILQWADGDAQPKSFSIPIDSSTKFTGSKTFAVVLSQPTGAAITTPSANVVIKGSATTGTGSPGAPGALTMTGQTASSIALKWGAATPGNGSIAYYKIYRNDSAYATATATSYVDYGATDATNGAFNAAATIYAYAVSAVDTDGNEGPQTTQTTYQVYGNGVFDWAGDYSYGVSVNYKDTGGRPESGPYDIAINVYEAYGGFQPYSGNSVPQWDLETGAFDYISLDLKPTIDNQSWRLSMISRLPPGDVYPWAAVDINSYGPSPVAGQWATYKIPLSALSMGKTSFKGSISGNTLTVTGVNSGVGVDAGGFITGDGVKPGTYIVGHNANGGPGTYTVSPAQNVATTSMTEQRTALYKLDIADQSGAWNNRYYIDNVRLTKE